MGRAVAGVVGVGHTVGAAITRRRTLGRDDVALVVAGACLLLGLTAMAVVFPRVVAVPVAFVGAWTALGLLARALRLWRTGADDARTGAGVVRGDETDG
jgi:cardiolipin synthase